MITLIGERLKILRKRLGLTQTEFAEVIPTKINYSYVGKLERGRQYPSLKLLETIGKTFRTPLGYFFEDHSFLRSFNLLPREIRDLLSNKTMQRLLILANKLNEKELGKAYYIIKILTEGGL